jgi:hypothetical protein
VNVHAISRVRRNRDTPSPRFRSGVRHRIVNEQAEALVAFVKSKR